MGPSGSGKSTLLHCLAGLDTLTSGQAYIGETDLATLSDRERTLVRRDRIGFVFQSFNLMPTLSAEENITLPARPRREPVDREWFDTVVDSSTSRTGSGTGRHSSPAGSSSASRWRGRSSRTRTWCSPTSPPAPSTPKASHRAARVPPVGRRRPRPDRGDGDPRPARSRLGRPGHLPPGRRRRRGPARPDRESVIETMRTLDY